VRSATRRYHQLIARFRRVRVAVVGDLLADEFIYGRVERVSREAPVLILRYDATEILPGGAGNAACNAAALGARVTIIGAVGRDDPGRRLLKALPPHADARAVLQLGTYDTPIKTRILAGSEHAAKQQVVRIDRVVGPVPKAGVQRIERAVGAAARKADAIIISDYGAGAITSSVWLRAQPVTNRRNPGPSGPGNRSKPITVVDSRYALAKFMGMTACTPNESEVEALLGIRVGNDDEALERAGRTLLRQLQAGAVLITRGSRGMALFQPDAPTDHIPIIGSDQVADVTGAGDTVIATFTIAIAAGATFSEAARLANYAGSIVVMKRGTATVTAEELKTAIN
jgi:D-glycero-beta-D-manno-heptose-7-phosphate kinase